MEIAKGNRFWNSPVYARTDYDAALLRFGQPPGALPLQPVAILLVERAEPGPEISADEQEQERNREEVERLDRKSIM